MINNVNLAVLSNAKSMRTIPLKFAIRGLLATVILIAISCQSEQNEGKPEIPSGWKEGMIGQIAYIIERFVESDFLLWVDENATHSLVVDGFELSGVSWSPDGSILVYANQESLHFKLQQGTVDSLLYDIYAYDSAAVFDPVWSPDGSRIAFATIRNDIRVMDLESGEIGIFEPPWLSCDWTDLDWSPDGKWVTFNTIYWDSNDPMDGKAVVAALDPDEGTYTVVDACVNAGTNAAWSPDGSRIALVRDYQAWIVNVSGGVPEQLTTFFYGDVTRKDKLLLLKIAWSPDSQYLAFGTNDGIYVTDLTGTVITRLKPGTWVFQLDWSI